MLAHHTRFTATVLRRIVLAGILVCGAPALAAADDELKLKVEVQGSEVTTDVEFLVRATPQVAWAVLTDFEHATEFVAGMERSVVLSSSGDTLLVSQKGSMDFGPFSAMFETITEVQLTPHESIRSRMVSGNMKKNQSVTLVSQEAGGTRVVHHMESIPDVWIPPLIGRILIEHEVRNRYRQLIAEILRRNAERTAELK